MGLAARLPAAAAVWMLLGTCVLPAARPADAAAAPGGIPSAPQRALDQFALQGPAIQGGLVSGTAPKGSTLLTLDGAPVVIAPDRRFLIGFDRDAGRSARLSARLDDGRAIVQILTVSPRAWDISRLSTLPKYPVPRPEFERVRPAELAQINAARTMRSDSQGWRQQFLWPVTGRISTLFGSQRIYAGEPGAYHSGVDIARPTGTPVIAPADGVVVLAAAKPFTLEGNLLMVDHGGGLNSAFMHLSRISVKVGEHVRRGQPIGAVGMTGRATGPHLHWGLKWRDARIDPLLHAGPMPAAD
jgi:murein DD-endopeptidase MepM/ murein hydrolase activator NlpD